MDSKRKILSDLRTVPTYGKYGDNDEDKDALLVDAPTLARTIITYEHHKIHDGDAYTTCRVVTLPAGGLANILIVTPDTKRRAHLTFQLVSDDLLTVNFYEAPDYSGGGALIAFNRDRDSTNTSGLTLTTDATDDGGGKGTLIWTFKAGANKTVVASESERFEFMLKQNSKYLVEAVGALNDNVTFLLDWYEHTGIH